jgi:hypothetical protein
MIADKKRVSPPDRFDRWLLVERSGARLIPGGRWRA